MKIIRYSIWILFLFYMLGGMALEMSAQKPKRCHQRIGFFAGRDPVKLCRKLCKGIDNDSDKVAAMYCWVTSHISYNYFKSKSNDFRVEDNKHILRNKTAICYGYATLFQQMCNLAGIQAAIVTGYTKNEATDICDSFYLEDHAWNAVNIDGEWRLCDLTWDAGYIVYWKRGLWNNLLYVLSIGRINKYKFKPRFKQAPTYNYYLKPGDYFVYDHLPSNPIWQLKTSISTVNDFIKDSSKYFYRMPSDTNTYATKFEGQRQNYISNTDTANEILDGFAFNRFNYKNHYQLQVSYMFKAMPLYRSLDFRSKDTAEMLKIADSTLSYSLPSISHSDSCLKYLDKEHGYLILHLNQKNTILKSQNKTLRNSSRKVLKFSLKGKKFEIRLEKYMQRSIRLNKRSLQNALYIPKTKNKNPPKKSKDSTKWHQQYNHLNSILELNRDTLYQLMEKEDSLISELQPRLDSAIYFEFNKGEAHRYCAGMRKTYLLDDFDYPMRTVKDTLLFKNIINDSMVQFFKKDLFDSIYNTFKEINRQYRKCFKIEKDQLKCLRALCKNTDASYLHFKTDLIEKRASMQAHFDALVDWQKTSIKKLETLRSLYQNLRFKARISLRYIRYENNFSLKPFLIHGRYNAIKRLSKRRARFAKMQTRKAVIIKDKYIRR